MKILRLGLQNTAPRKNYQGPLTEFQLFLKALFVKYVKNRICHQHWLIPFYVPLYCGYFLTHIPSGGTRGLDVIPFVQTNVPHLSVGQKEHTRVFGDLGKVWRLRGVGWSLWAKGMGTVLWPRCRSLNPGVTTCQVWLWQDCKTSFCLRSLVCEQGDKNSSHPRRT